MDPTPDTLHRTCNPKPWTRSHQVAAQHSSMWTAFLCSWRRRSIFAWTNTSRLETRSHYYAALDKGNDSRFQFPSCCRSRLNLRSKSRPRSCHLGASCEALLAKCWRILTLYVNDRFSRRETHLAHPISGWSWCPSTWLRGGWIRGFRRPSFWRKRVGWHRYWTFSSLRHWSQQDSWSYYRRIWTLQRR